MSSLLPAVVPNKDILPPGKQARAARIQTAAVMRVWRHAVDSQANAMCDQIDSQATREAMQTALDEECGLYDYGLMRADGSAVKLELAARKVEMLANTNNRRLTRRFGG
jgi:hypothetical protein